MESDGVSPGVESGSGELYAHVDDVFAQIIRNGVRVGAGCARFRGDRLSSTGIELGQNLVDALPGDTESFGDFCDGFTLFDSGFDDSEVAVGTVHLVNHVPAHPACLSGPHRRLLM